MDFASNLHDSTSNDSIIVIYDSDETNFEESEDPSEAEEEEEEDKRANQNNSSKEGVLDLSYRCDKENVKPAGNSDINHIQCNIQESVLNLSVRGNDKESSNQATNSQCNSQAIYSQRASTTCAPENIINSMPPQMQEFVEQTQTLLKVARLKKAHTPNTFLKKVSEIPGINFTGESSSNSNKLESQASQRINSLTTHSRQQQLESQHPLYFPPEKYSQLFLSNASFPSSNSNVCIRRPTLNPYVCRPSFLGRGFTSSNISSEVLPDLNCQNTGVRIRQLNLLEPEGSKIKLAVQDNNGKPRATLISTATNTTPKSASLKTTPVARVTPRRVATRVGFRIHNKFLVTKPSPSINTSHLGAEIKPMSSFPAIKQSLSLVSNSIYFKMQRKLKRLRKYIKTLERRLHLQNYSAKLAQGKGKQPLMSVSESVAKLMTMSNLCPKTIEYRDPQGRTVGFEDAPGMVVSNSKIILPHSSPKKCTLKQCNCLCFCSNEENSNVLQMTSTMMPPLSRNLMELLLSQT